MLSVLGPSISQTLKSNHHLSSSSRYPFSSNRTPSPRNSSCFFALLIPDGASCASPKNPPIAYNMSLVISKAEAPHHSLRLRRLCGGTVLLAQRGFFVRHLQLRAEMNQALLIVQHRTIFFQTEFGAGGHILAASVSMPSGM